MLGRGSIVFLMACVLAPSSCVVPPVPLKKRIEAPNGTKIADLSFVNPGVTTREQVNERLKSIDTGVTPGLFWGRFNQSNKSDPGWNRAWSRGNLLIAYDDQGLVKTARRVGDKEMNRILFGWLVARGMQRAFHPAIQIETTSRHGPIKKLARLFLHDSEFSFVELGEQPTRTFNVAPAKIKRIRASTPDLCCDDKARAEIAIEETIWIEASENRIRQLVVQVSPENLVVLLDYIRLHCPDAKYE